MAGLRTGYPQQVANLVFPLASTQPVRSSLAHNQFGDIPLNFSGVAIAGMSCAWGRGGLHVLCRDSEPRLEAAVSEHRPTEVKPAVNTAEESGGCRCLSS